jgi:hypothetical protein
MPKRITRASEVTWSAAECNPFHAIVRIRIGLAKPPRSTGDKSILNYFFSAPCGFAG